MILEEKKNLTGITNMNKTPKVILIYNLSQKRLLFLIYFMKSRQDSCEEEDTSKLPHLQNNLQLMRNHL